MMTEELVDLCHVCGLRPAPPGDLCPVCDRDRLYEALKEVIETWDAPLTDYSHRMYDVVQHVRKLL